MKKILSLWALLCLGQTSAKTELPKVVNHDGVAFEICDQHTVRYALVLKVADAAWYSDDCDRPNGLIDNPSKVLKFIYHRDIPKKFFVKAANEFFIKNTQSDDLPSFQAPLTLFNSKYTDINANESYELIQYNGCLTLLKDGAELIKLYQPQFAAQYFSIWFGKEPAIKKLRNAFL